MIIKYFLLSQIVLKGEILPLKEKYLLDEPMTLKVIFKNIGATPYRLIRLRYWRNVTDFLKLEIYKDGVRLPGPRFSTTGLIILPEKVNIENWKKEAPIILFPGDSFVYYFNLTTLWDNLNYIFVKGNYLLKKIRAYWYSESYRKYIREKVNPLMDYPIWCDVLEYEMNLKFTILPYEGELKKIKILWNKTREKRLKELDYSLYPEVIEMCSDNSILLPNLLMEYVFSTYKTNRHVPDKKRYVKKFFSFYNRFPWFYQKYIKSKGWLKVNILPLGKSFIDSLPSEVREKIYKTLGEEE